MPERLELTKNAQFYVPIAGIDDSIINNILGSAALLQCSNKHQLGVFI